MPCMSSFSSLQFACRRVALQVFSHLIQVMEAIVICVVGCAHDLGCPRPANFALTSEN